MKKNYYTNSFKDILMAVLISVLVLCIVLVLCLGFVETLPQYVCCAVMGLPLAIIAITIPTRRITLYNEYATITNDGLIFGLFAVQHKDIVYYSQVKDINVVSDKVDSNGVKIDHRLKYFYIVFTMNNGDIKRFILNHHNKRTMIKIVTEIASRCNIELKSEVIETMNNFHSRKY